MKPILITAAFLCALTSACKSTETDEPTPLEPIQRWAEQQEPTLYARDGSVVQGPKTARSDQPGSKNAGEAAATSDDPRHDIGARDGSRMYLLELYQKSVEEREALAREVKSLQQALDEVGNAQAKVEKERDGALAQIARLQTELEKSRTDNQDLAGRLLTAQIRRLEAEKLLLETRIETMQRDAAERDDAAKPQEAASAQSGANLPAAPAKPVASAKPKDPAAHGDHR